MRSGHRLAEASGADAGYHCVGAYLRSRKTGGASGNDGQRRKGSPLVFRTGDCPKKKKHVPTQPAGCAGNLPGVVTRFAGSEWDAGRQWVCLAVYSRLAVRPQ